MVLYVLLICLGVHSFIKTRKPWYFGFPLWGGLDICTNILDKYFLSSNLELLLINHYLISIIIILIVRNMKTWSNNGLILLKIIPFIFFILICFLFLFDIKKIPIRLYSQYGFLNLYEYTYASFGISVILTIVCIIVLIGRISSNTYSIGQIFIIFGLIVYYSTNVVNFVFSNFLFLNSKEYYKFLIFFFPSRLIISYGLLYTGLLWKK